MRKPAKTVLKIDLPWQGFCKYPHMLPEDFTLPDHEYELTAIRSSGPGGQHVNKVSTAILLRFDIAASSLPQEAKDRLLRFSDHRITESGIVLIKADEHRSQKKNREEAVERLHDLIRQATKKKKKRTPTKVPKGAKETRLRQKAQRSATKKARGNVTPEQE